MRVETTVTVLEKVVDNMVSLRQDDRAAMRELGERMERSVSSMTEEIRKLAEKTATQDMTVIAEQAKERGAKEANNYFIGTLIAILGLVIGFGSLVMAFQAGKNSGTREAVPYELAPQGRPRSPEPGLR